MGFRLRAGSTGQRSPAVPRLWGGQPGVCPLSFPEQGFCFRSFSGQWGGGSRGWEISLPASIPGSFFPLSSNPADFRPFGVQGAPPHPQGRYADLQTPQSVRTQLCSRVAENPAPPTGNPESTSKQGPLEQNPGRKLGSEVGRCVTRSGESILM